MVVSVAAPMSEAKLEALLTSGAGGEEGKEPEVVAKGKVEGEEAAATPAAGEAKGEKKEAGDAKTEKKEAKVRKEEVSLRLNRRLGNPGRAYAATRHNVGVMALEQAAMVGISCCGKGGPHGEAKVNSIGSTSRLSNR